MLRTYELSRSDKMPLYEQLYRAIRQDILAGVLKGGEKLPSKRVLAEHLSLSKITVETAYAQLLAEGYITSRQRAGYFVEALSPAAPMPPAPPMASEEREPPAPTAQPTLFPFSIWAKLIRAVLLEQQDAILSPVPPEGLYALRKAIANELFSLRGMTVRPEQILIGAGAEYFYSLLISFLGRSRTYALEQVGHRKIAGVYAAEGAKIVPIEMDADGILPKQLYKSGADVLHLTPSHHYPTGAITSVGRRQEILRWLEEDARRLVIEDDFDSEFRFAGLPIPTLSSMDTRGRVIYMNTFSKTITPALRISYMILPQALLETWKKTMGVYACPVPSFEQYTLARFLSEGYFEKHLGRLKKHYRTLRAALLRALSEPPLSEKLTVLQGAAGLQLLLRPKTDKNEAALAPILSRCGIAPLFLSDFYITSPPPSARGCLVLRYDDYAPEALIDSLKTLCAAL